MFFNEEGDIDDDDEQASSEDDEDEENEEGQFLAQSNGNHRRELTMEDITSYKEMMRAQMIAAGGKYEGREDYEDNEEDEEEEEY